MKDIPLNFKLVSIKQQEQESLTKFKFHWKQKKFLNGVGSIVLKELYMWSDMNKNSFSENQMNCLFKDMN